MDLFQSATVISSHIILHLHNVFGSRVELAKALEEPGKKLCWRQGAVWEKIAVN